VFKNKQMNFYLLKKQHSHGASVVFGWFLPDFKN